MAGAVRWLPAVAGLALAACGGSADQAAQAGGGAHASFERYSYTNEFGTRTYKVYVPASLPAGTAVPLLIDLPGCGSDADEESRWSRFNDHAEARGMIVAYPEQASSANGGRCWNFFLPEHQERNAGEPSIIAGITREVAGRWQTDPARTYVSGISSGGAMAVNMAVTYPDLYAAVMVYSGCAYKAEPPCFTSVNAVPDDIGGQWAYEASEGRGRVVPLFMIQGDADPLVPYPNAEKIVQQFLVMDDWADDGGDNGSVARAPAATTPGQVPGGHSYSIDTYRDTRGCVLAERWLINGMGHAWSQGQPADPPTERDTLLIDPLGPDVSTATIDFLLSHRMPDTGTGCTEASGTPP
jgi:poly(hydroxyalkanoate) depolymerase family esterase